jgi:hypothetical protein
LAAFTFATSSVREQHEILVSVLVKALAGGGSAGTAVPKLFVRNRTLPASAKATVRAVVILPALLRLLLFFRFNIVNSF